MNKLLVFDSLPSTNEFALNLENPYHGDSILAYRQTQGRGQYGRIWNSMPGGLYLSIILEDVNLDNITLEIGEIVRKYLEELTNEEFDIKLPNDILYRSEKICGILVESKTCGENVWAVAGIGLNVNNENYINLSKIMGRKLEILVVAENLRKQILEGINYGKNS